MEPRPIANRESNGAIKLPGVIQILSLGEFEKNGEIYVIDEIAIATMQEQFSSGEGLLIDFDFDSRDPNKRTTAAGWGQALQAQPEGLFLEVHWSKSGADAITGEEYRFSAPILLRDECEPCGLNRIRPLRLDGLGLTNKPRPLVVGSIKNRSADDGDNLSAPSSPWHAADKWHQMVQSYAADHNCSYESAHAKLKIVEPGHYENVLRLMRAPQTPESSFSNKVAFGQDLVPLTCPPAGAADKFHHRVLAHAKEHNLSYERAFEKVRRTHPFDFGKAMRLAEFAEPKTKGSAL